MRVVFLLVTMLALAACGGGQPDGPPVDTTGAVAEDSTDAFNATPAEIPEAVADDDRAPGIQPFPIEEDDSPEGEEPPPTEASTGPPPLPARYRLAYVEGEEMPVIIDENPDCRVELVEGDLWIKEDQSFELRASTRTTCGGELISDDLQQARGTVERAGDRLHFEATSGEIFAAARGSFTVTGHINIDTLELGGEAAPVDWRFLR